MHVRGLIKVKTRSAAWRVFTPAWMSEEDARYSWYKEACENINATFLEPAAGDGNFLLAILERAEGCNRDSMINAIGKPRH